MLDNFWIGYIVDDVAPAPEKAKQDWQLECKYTLSEVQQHNTLDDCWMVIFDKVYNITDFVYEHPGGDFILFEYAGRDATHPFLSSRHGSSAYKMLDKYWIGILVDEELYYSNNSSYCSVYLSLSWRSTPTLEVNKNDPNNSATDKTDNSTSNSTSTTSQSDERRNSSSSDSSNLSDEGSEISESSERNESNESNSTRSSGGISDDTSVRPLVGVDSGKLAGT